MKLDTTWLNALAAAGIESRLLCRFDFASETICAWNGIGSIIPTGTGDALLDGNTFDPVSAGVVYQIGNNSYSMNGSDNLDLTLSVGSSWPDDWAEAAVNKDEYLARPFTMWRAIMITPPGLSTPAAWRFRRVRSGAMDTLQFINDGSQSIIKLTIQSQAAYIANASGSLWSDQKTRYDGADTSQDYEASIQTSQPLVSGLATTTAYKPTASTTPAGPFSVG